MRQVPAVVEAHPQQPLIAEFATQLKPLCFGEGHHVLLAQLVEAIGGHGFHQNRPEGDQVRVRAAVRLHISVLGGALMVAERIDVVRAVSILGALPFTLVLLLQISALLKAMRRDAVNGEGNR